MLTTYFDHRIKGFVPIGGEQIEDSFVYIGRQVDKDGKITEPGEKFKAYTDEEREAFWKGNTGGGIGIDADGISPKWLPRPEKTAEEKQAEYEDAVNAKIREKYTLSQELAILRQRDAKPEEYEKYNAYCEACKAAAKSKVAGSA